ncbi:MAG: hypothetical protein ACYST0_14285, partial [Planctomycetota bacterium]
RWLYYLFCRPTAFFRHFVVEPVPMLTVLTCYLFGVANTIDQLEFRMLRGQMTGRSGIPALAADSWQVFWAMSLFLGVVSGCLIYWIGSWWYHKRLEMSDATKPDPRLSRRVYFFASLVWVLPTLVYAGWRAGAYDTPRMAVNGDDWGWAPVFGFLFWSLVTSYRGVTTAFVLHRGKALVWFVVLPAALYAFTLFFGVVIGLLVSESGTTPNLRTPNTYSRPAFQLRYPGNWIVNTQVDSHDPDGNVLIQPPLADCAVFLHFLTGYAKASEALADYQTYYAESFNVHEWATATTWGPHACAAASGTGRSEGEDYRVNLFALQHGTQWLVVQELCHMPALENMRAGFRLIQRSFKWR